MVGRNVWQLRDWRLRLLGMAIELAKLVNHKIIVIGPEFFSQDKLETVTLVSVEDAGIWIESDEAAKGIVAKFQVAPSAPGLVFFIPFGKITTILAGVDATSGE